MKDEDDSGDEAEARHLLAKRREEALLPKERRGRAGYAEDNLKGMTIAQATEINEDALRFYGIPPGTWNTSAEYRDVVRYRSDSDESDY